MSIFDRFSEGARRVVSQAMEEARSLKHHYIGTEHLMLGLLQTEGTRAHALLTEAGMSYESVRNAIIGAVGLGEQPVEVEGYTPGPSAASRRPLWRPGGFGSPPWSRSSCFLASSGIRIPSPPGRRLRQA